MSQMSNEAFKVQEVYVFISEAEDGDEGIIAQIIDMVGVEMPVYMPFVAADKKRLQQLKPMAQKIAKESGKKVKVIRLSVREEIEVY